MHALHSKRQIPSLVLLVLIGLYLPSQSPSLSYFGYHNAVCNAILKTTFLSPLKHLSPLQFQVHALLISSLSMSLMKTVTFMKANVISDFSLYFSIFYLLQSKVPNQSNLPININEKIKHPISVILYS